MKNLSYNAGSVTPAQHSALYWVVGDTFTMIKRCSRHITRNLDSLLIAVVLPITILLLFVYVFGGAINTGIEYINYVVPGIILLCAGYGASTTAVSVTTDMTTGIMDRFRSLPILSATVLIGHVVASVVRNFISTILVFGVALLLGFHPAADPLAWLVVVSLLLLYILAISWLGVIFGLLANSPEGAGAFSFFILFVPYVSSAFVPTETMPEALHFFAKNQPITPIIESVRSLLRGVPLGDNIWLALAWITGILVVSYLVATYLFRRKMAN